ncbi:MAG TPA: VIT1/CCC1 transporter family protein [Verrucomicrobiales bacterium]|nr:VIT1/CCC1 transporter family protein [Verrucomicrobiales bacterium]
MPHSRQSLKRSHTPEAIRRRLSQPNGQPVLKDLVYGAIDGAVTTFAVVSGVAGAGLPNSVIIVLGLANLFADGFSMAASNFLGCRAENQAKAKARRDEKEHIRVYPEGETEEIRQIFAAKGFSGDVLDQIVRTITEDERRWVDTMVQEELGYSLSNPSPIKAALATFVAFLVIGAIPLASFLLNALNPGTIPHPFLWSAVLTGVAFFVVGALKARVVEERWPVSGIETLAVGGSAAAIAYGIGILLKSMA